MVNEVVLRGCRTVPMINYLKSLGVFRLIAEQKDGNVKARWTKDGRFALHCAFDSEELVDFFMREYQPSLFFNPWGGGSGFWKEKDKTARQCLEILYDIDDDRMTKFKETAEIVKRVISSLGFEKKPENEEAKLRLMMALRSSVPDYAIEWLDACYVLTEDGRVFNVIFGTGGNEGRGSYTENYLKSLVEVMTCDPSRSLELLLHSLLDVGTPALSDLVSGQFNPGPIAEVNAVDNDYLAKNKVINPWDFVLAMEGAVLFSGSVARRLSGTDVPEFPFTVSPSNAGSHHISGAEKGFDREFWLPVWYRPATYREIKYLFKEGRVQIGRRVVKTGLEFARALATLGVDRGIDSFVRYGRLKRQGSGDKANPIAIFLDQIDVKMVPETRLLDDLDWWLDRLRGASNDKNSGPRYRMHLKAIEDAIYEVCKYGDRERLLRLLLVLGRVERSLARMGHKGEDEGVGDRVPPLHLDPSWIGATYDGSVEYRIALSLASIYDPEIGPMRVYMEPLKWEEGKLGSKWSSRGSKLVWSQAPLPDNMARVLLRRVIEGQKRTLKRNPVGARITANLSDAIAFLEGRVNERKIEDLLWALITIKWEMYDAECHGIEVPEGRPTIIPASYALFKLLYLPGNLTIKNSRWVHTYGDEGIRISACAEVIRLLQSRQFERAVEFAVRRIIASGAMPKGIGGSQRAPPDLFVKGLVARRMAGTLLIPIREVDVIAGMMLKKSKKEEVME